MGAFRVLLALLFIGIIAFTLVAGLNHGWNLFQVFADDLTAMNWAGQFNFDFSSYLMLSGLWVAWRHQFSGKGLIFGAIASVFGILFFAPYLFIESFKHNGDVRSLLLGEANRAA